SSIDDILAAVREHNRLTGGRVTFEYVLLQGVNDSPAQARRLAERIRGLRTHVNLIPLNPSQGVVGERPSRRATLRFQQTLQECGIPATVRVEQGRDIAAACGQLRGDRVRRTRQPGNE
ncbi:MAG: 23S rRNA (adenine(2503)-C(2))-methyltransferase RlmN, partial [Chloroflexi bacterium]|nr:23S rRNA (adenine(2503)-C(2))-methyltransferase RlmN [Chloroflexota bacterium]